MTRRFRLGALAAVCAAGAAYGSFVPLRWHDLTWAEGFHRFLRLPFGAHPLVSGDFSTNVLVFLPIGFLAAGALAPYAPRAWHLLPVVAGCLLLSTSIEFLQVFIRARTASWNDVIGQGLGGLLGAALWVLAGPRAGEWIAGIWRSEPREQRVFRLLVLYGAGWLGMSALPLVFPRLAHPQLALWRDQIVFSQALLAGPIVLAGLAALPLGVLAAMAVQRGPSRALGPVVVAGSIGLLVAADRVRQVGFLPTDGHLGASLLGFAVAYALAGAARGSAFLARPKVVRRCVQGGLLAVLAVLALHYWAPWNFGVSAESMELRVRILYERAPFHRYYWLPPLIALGEIVTVVLLAATVAALLWWLRLLTGRAPRSGFVAGAAVAVFTLVEWGQLYLPGRRADPTDVLLAAAGAAMGIAVARALEGSALSPRAGS